MESSKDALVRILRQSCWYLRLTQELTYRFHETASLRRTYFSCRLKFLFTMAESIYSLRQISRVSTVTKRHGASSILATLASFPLSSRNKVSMALRLRPRFDPRARHLIREYLQKEYVNKPAEIFMLLLLYFIPVSPSSRFPSSFASRIRLYDAHMMMARSLVSVWNFRARISTCKFPANFGIDTFLLMILLHTVIKTRLCNFHCLALWHLRCKLRESECIVNLSERLWKISTRSMKF